MSYQGTFGAVEQNAKGWELVEYYFEPILPFYSDDSVNEIMVNRYDEIWIEKNSRMEFSGAKFESEAALKTAIEQLAKVLHQDFDDDHPILDARFPDQSRANATIQSMISPDGSTLTIRRAPKKHYTIDELLGFGAMSPDMANYLKHAIVEFGNAVVAGGTGSGKTTILRALTRFIPDGQRVISAEDTRELHLTWIRNKISMEAPKRRYSEGVEPVRLPTLIVNTLRQRADRVLVGEIRDGAAADAYLQACESSQGGCWTTTHANSAHRTIKRFQYLLAAGGTVSYDLAGQLFMEQVHIVVHAARKPGIGKKVMEIVEIIDGEPRTVFLYDKRQKAHVATEWLDKSLYWPVPPDILALEGL